MADAIKLNYFDPVADIALWQMAKAFQGEPDTVYVFIHGTPTSVVDYSNGRADPVYLSPLELAQKVDGAGASRDSKVVLVACATAQDMDSFARDFSQYYPVVVGATRTLWVATDHVHNESELFALANIAGEGRDGKANRLDQGKWKYYFAQDYQYCKAHTEVCDPPESEKPPPTHRFNVLGHKFEIKEDDIVSPVTRFKLGQASEPVSPDKEAKRREVMAELFSNIVEMELKGHRGRGQLARTQVIHHYPELAYGFVAFDNSVRQSKLQSELEPKEYLGDRLAEIYFVIKNGYPIERGIKTYVRVTPIVESESEAQQAYSR